MPVFERAIAFEGVRHGSIYQCREYAVAKLRNHSIPDKRHELVVFEEMNAGCEGEVGENVLGHLNGSLSVIRVDGGAAEALGKVGLGIEEYHFCSGRVPKRRTTIANSGQEIAKVLGKHRLSIQLHLRRLEKVAESEELDADVHHVVSAGESLIFQVDTC